MGVQALVSLVTIGLIVSRAVNILASVPSSSWAPAIPAGGPSCIEVVDILPLSSSARSSRARRCFASPMTTVCAGCCARSRAVAGIRQSELGSCRWTRSARRRWRCCSRACRSPPVVSESLARALERQRALRSHDECVLDVARPRRELVADVRHRPRPRDRGGAARAP